MAIVKTTSGPLFSSEFELEETVWQHLKRLLKLSPLKRQYAVNGQFCDILATDDLNCLVVIELKNTEDRYIVQQLTRYYDALCEDTALKSLVDTRKPIRLIAIAPRFHRDTLIDCKYNQLSIELMTFDLVPQDDSYRLRLTNLDTKQSTSIKLSSSEPATTPAARVLPDPPRKLLNWLAHSSKAEYDGILNARKQLLGADPRMREIVDGSRILYGRGKTMTCAEIRTVKSGDARVPRLFLWLPHLGDKPHVLRMMVWASKDWQKVEAIVYSPSSTKTKIVWNFPECVHRMQRIGYKNSFKLYKPVMSSGGDVCVVFGLINLSLETWRKRYRPSLPPRGFGLSHPQPAQP